MWISLWSRLALCWQNLELLQDHAEEVEDAVLCKLFPGTLSTAYAEGNQSLFLQVVWGNNSSILNKPVRIKLPRILPVSEIKTPSTAEQGGPQMPPDYWQTHIDLGLNSMCHVFFYPQIVDWVLCVMVFFHVSWCFCSTFDLDLELWPKSHKPGRTDRQMDRRYQTYYLPALRSIKIVHLLTM